MIGKLIGAFAGSKLAENTRSIGGPAGAVLGVGAATIARRLSLPALVAITAGGYLFSKYQEKSETSKTTKAEPSSTSTAPKVEPVPAA